MKHRPILAVLLAVAAFVLVGAQAASAHRGFGGGRLVFVQTNELAGNQIAVYHRGHDGQLTRIGTYATGGLGGAAAPGTESDRLASQGSLAFVPRHHQLIAVNAGSNTVSAFRLRGDMLELENVVPSGGQFPVSLGVRGGLVYVLNSGGAGSVSGFLLGPDGLTPIPGSGRSLGLANATPPNFLTSPGQVGFTPDGKQLLVTTKASTSSIDVFRVAKDGLLSATPVVNPSATPVPFAFTFAGNLLVSGEAGASSVTTYRVSGAGSLNGALSASDGQGALCWIERVGNVFFVSNTATNNLSSFGLGPNGQPILLSAVAATTNPGPIDLAGSGRFLYAETGINGTVDEFRIGPNGTLTPIGSVDDLPPGIEGIAAT
jgi:hypothetical protein